jgi:hypothetical protein
MCRISVLLSDVVMMAAYLNVLSCDLDLILSGIGISKYGRICPFQGLKTDYLSYTETIKVFKPFLAQQISSRSNNFN